MPRTLTLPALALAAGLLAACDTGTGPSPSPGCVGACGSQAAEPASETALHVSLHGLASITGDYAVSDPDTCGNLAKPAPDGGGYAIPDNPEGETVAGHNLSIDVNIAAESYHGPGTYPVGALDVEATAVDIDDGGDIQPSTAKASATLTVRADGGGDLTFEGWTDPGGNVLGGTLSWTCRDVTGSAAPQPT